MSALASEAVADKHWRWLPGMLDTDGRRVLSVRERIAPLEGSWLNGVDLGGSTVTGRLAHAKLPDLDDAATLGCLLALVREAWGRDVFVEHHGDGLWRVHQAHREYVIGVGRLEAAALVAALLGAP